MTLIVESSTTNTASVTTIPLWIDGRPAASHSTRQGDVTNPATGAVIRRVPFANREDVDAAAKAAAAAFPGWRATPALKRARILTRFRELLEQHQKDIARLI